MTPDDETAADRRYPSYRELLQRHDAPAGSSWGLFGDGHRYGTLNFIGAREVVAASTLVRDGRVLTLDYEISAFRDDPAGTRPAARHTITSTNSNHRDDRLDSYHPQASSQIDGLRHIRHPEHGFYGGTADADVSVESAALGIGWWAERGIVGRGVLLDVHRHRHDVGRPLALDENDPISVDDLEGARARAGVPVRPGDAVLVHTGWAEHYLHGLDARARRSLSGRPASPGLDQSHDVLEWIWDHRVALVASDNLSVERMPPRPDSPFAYAEATATTGISNRGLMHRPMIALLGLVLGELWRLAPLAEDCARDGRYDFMLVAKPLNVRGGVGSPANALAIK